MLEPPGSGMKRTGDECGCGLKDFACLAVTQTSWARRLIDAEMKVERRGGKSYNDKHQSKPRRSDSLFVLRRESLSRGVCKSDLF